ncbi:hypothetical protein [Paraburkholderia kirstenboschensis]|uniref:Uncharacterized protein n=1 Tax=Paraburkholderia kirstenboschensis TaxID=1245436 RepID=A0ABZ0EB56_9BURK|nr:hypothetical protein [Paraburkholderia kirstenboschensis]WOD14471.1 hypothetical protein RW095_03105 [Paraburkholderia kirstenboschensis]
MTSSSNLDDEARAGLLCYLVVGQLVALARTGGWLRTDHYVELLNIWFHSNGAEAAWLQGVRLEALSQKTALDFARLPPSLIRLGLPNCSRTAGEWIIVRQSSGKSARLANAN